jgi:hypothetical protein
MRVVKYGILNKKHESLLGFQDIHSKDVVSGEGKTKRHYTHIMGNILLLSTKTEAEKVVNNLDPEIFQNVKDHVVVEVILDFRII